MQVILKEDVVGVGDIGDTVTVKPGHARNFLIPNGLAIESQAKNAKAIAHHMRQIESKKKMLKGGAEELAKQIADMSFEFGLRVGKGGKVFGSVSTRDIAAELAKQGVEVDRRRVLLSEPIKKIGARTVEVKLHPEVRAELSLTVKPLAATKAEEQAEADEAKEKIEAAAVEGEEVAEAVEVEGEESEEQPAEDEA